MSRSGYCEDSWGDDEGDNWRMIMFRGQVASAIRGKRGQAFLKELIVALEAMPEKRLIAEELIDNGEVCALGCVGRARGMDLEKLDPENHEGLATAFGIAQRLITEIEYENDETCSTPEHRWEWMHRWAKQNLTPEKASDAKKES